MLHPMGDKEAQSNHKTDLENAYGALDGKWRDCEADRPNDLVAQPNLGHRPTTCPLQLP
jgi:hypothetical protein